MIHDLLGTKIKIGWNQPTGDSGSSFHIHHIPSSKIFKGWKINMQTTNERLLILDLLENHRGEAHIQSRHVVVNHQAQNHPGQPELCGFPLWRRVEPQDAGVLCHKGIEQTAVHGEDVGTEKPEKLTRQPAFIDALLTCNGSKKVSVLG